MVEDTNVTQPYRPNCNCSYPPYSLPSIEVTNTNILTSLQIQVKYYIYLLLVINSM